MKKQTMLLMAGGLLTFAACNNNQAPGQPSEATIDSMVNAKMEMMKTEWSAKNDSIINAMAQMKADSIVAAMKGAKVTTSTKTTKTIKVIPPPQTTANTVDPQTSRNNQNTSIEDQKRRNNDQKSIEDQQKRNNH